MDKSSKTSNTDRREQDSEDEEQDREQAGSGSNGKDKEGYEDTRTEAERRFEETRLRRVSTQGLVSPSGGEVSRSFTSNRHIGLHHQ